MSHDQVPPGPDEQARGDHEQECRKSEAQSLEPSALTVETARKIGMIYFPH